ncbi:hypothetical protein SGFS_026400 [Streptomyces graminofaciens]|uniref:Integral membrane protein n=1 Tax=Streptomyces graminofaciens TaxID=68212 RepID=A0ABN5VDT4_9ACTN|nr:hypothetical protein [Streptomyces graminofaciens]BBC31346.1 hypothetical protein SGFS_026400 [Streptomyces graminofaciens]
MSTTGRELTRRLWILLALGAATTLVLFGAYRGVHDDGVPLAESSEPGILAVDTALKAVNKAHKEVVEGESQGDAASRFHIQMSVVHQNIALAAFENLNGQDARQGLQTVTGLITVYSVQMEYVQQVGREPNGSALRKVQLHFAEQVKIDIEGRLETLRNDELGEAGKRASFPWYLWLGWSTVLVLSLALCATLVETQWFWRRRFHRAVHPPLLAATVLYVAGVAVLGWVTLEARAAMPAYAAALGLPRDRDGAPSVGEDVGEHMRHAGFWASLSDGVLIGGVVLMALVVAGLWPRISEYRFKAPR